MFFPKNRNEDAHNMEKLVSVHCVRRFGGERSLCSALDISPCEDEAAFRYAFGCSLSTAFPLPVDKPIIVAAFSITYEPSFNFP
jgi:hypothetical protein